MAAAKRAPWIVYGPVWLKQWFVEAVLWLWELFGKYFFLYLFLVMFGFFCLLWSEAGLWAGLIGGNLLGLFFAIVFALGGFAILVCLCLAVEIACAPFYLAAQRFSWHLPEFPHRSANLAEHAAFKKQLERACETDFGSDDSERLALLKEQNSLLKLGLLLLGIDLFFSHFGDDE